MNDSYRGKCMPVSMLPILDIHGNMYMAMVAGVTHVVSPNEVTACSNTYIQWKAVT